MHQNDTAALLAVIAAIIHAGGDDNERAPGYSVRSAVNRAKEILTDANAAVEAMAEEAEAAADAAALAKAARPRT